MNKMSLLKAKPEPKSQCVRACVRTPENNDGGFCLCERRVNVASGVQNSSCDSFQTVSRGLGMAWSSHFPCCAFSVFHISKPMGESDSRLSLSDRTGWKS